jgi:hypothetical protein
MSVNTGPIEIRGNLFFVDRADVNSVTAGYVGTNPAGGRLEEVPGYRLGSDVKMGKKSGPAPAWSRINGDWIELDIVITDYNESLVKLITNNRNSGANFQPGATGVKHGHLLREANYSAIIFRDATAPLDSPALYIPYALTIESSYLAGAGAKHAETCSMKITSIGYKTDEAPFYYGDITTFPGYVAPVEP